MALTLEQLLAEKIPLEKWMPAVSKKYTAYLSVVPRTPDGKPIVVENKSLGTKFLAPCGSFILCRPYKDIRLIDASFLNNCTDSKGKRGKDLVNEHCKKMIVNGCPEPQVVLPWTTVEVTENLQNVLAYRVEDNSSTRKNIGVVNPGNFLTGKNMPHVTNLKINSSQSNGNGEGDYLVCLGVQTPNGLQPNLSTLDIINGRTFTELYDMRHHRDMNIKTEQDARDKPAELAQYISLAENMKDGYQIILEKATELGLIAEFEDKSKETLRAVKVPVSADIIPTKKPEGAMWGKISPTAVVKLKRSNNGNVLKLIIKDKWTLASLAVDRCYKATYITSTDVKTVPWPNGISLAEITKKL